MKLRYVLVDVFADRPLAGNPLAVFPDAAGLEDETLQLIARAFQRLPQLGRHSTQQARAGAQESAHAAEDTRVGCLGTG